MPNKHVPKDKEKRKKGKRKRHLHAKMILFPWMPTTSWIKWLFQSGWLFFQFNNLPSTNRARLLYLARFRKSDTQCKAIIQAWRKSRQQDLLFTLSFLTTTHHSLSYKLWTSKETTSHQSSQTIWPKKKKRRSQTGAGVKLGQIFIYLFLLGLQIYEGSLAPMPMSLLIKRGRGL